MCDHNVSRFLEFCFPYHKDLGKVRICLFEEDLKQIFRFMKSFVEGFARLVEKSRLLG